MASDAHPWEAEAAIALLSRLGDRPPTAEMAHVKVAGGVEALRR